MVQELGSYVKGSKNPTTQTSTPKIVEEVVTKVMKVDKAAELFQTMAIVNLNMGNLIMEVNTLKNILDIGRRRMQCYKRNWIRREISKRGINIMWKFGGITWKRLSIRLKCSLRNCKMRMKSSRVAQHG